MSRPATPPPNDTDQHAPYITEDPTDFDQHRHAVKVFDGVSDPATSGRLEPVQVIYWDSVDQYYPPQALWVTRSSD